jgi:5'-nucleotidase
MTEPLILVSNDDGINASGIKALAVSLSHLGRVVVVAPLTDQSAVSHAMSLRRPLRLVRAADLIAPASEIPVYGVDGTPTDAVYMAAHHILKNQKISLVVSGINHGANLGNDLLYSGTVSAAMEGVFLGIQAVAISLVSNHDHDFSAASKFAAELCCSLLKNPLPQGTMLNVNVPKKVTNSRFAATLLGEHGYEQVAEQRMDPRGQAYYWISGKWSGYQDLPGTDCNAVAQGNISVTPIEIKLTCQKLLPWVCDLKIEGYSSLAQYLESVEK